MADHNRNHRDTDRTRSRSPRRHDSHSHSHSHRTRSPHTHRHHHRRKRSPETVSAPKELPYNARQLSKRDLDAFKPMFGLFLDIQKGKVIEEMDETEVKGRWKSFMGKWNRGELAEGWYDPATLQKAVQSAVDPELERPRATESRMESGREEESGEAERDDAQDSDSDESIGPALPGEGARSRGRMGPSIPGMEDLELKREIDAEDASTRRDDMRFARKVDRKEQKAALDEIVPRAEAGTRERQLEKKKEVNEKMKSFREKSPGAAEVPDTELMGGGDGIDGYKKQKQEFERKKNERELRKEEILRARQAERDERMSEYRKKEDGTMAMLKELAKQRFG